MKSKMLWMLLVPFFASQIEVAQASSVEIEDESDDEEGDED